MIGQAAVLCIIHKLIDKCEAMATRDFTGKTALITGAGSGIGRASAIAFAKLGASVVVVDINELNATETVNIINNQGNEAISIEADVSSSTAVERLFQEVIKVQGRLDFAHNNAGIEGDIAKTAECTEENWDRVINTNLKSIWLCMKYEIPHMINQGFGAIVNTSSVYGLVGCERGMPAYATSKHGIIGLTKTAALEYASAGIRVNCICAGPVDTPFRGRLVSRSKSLSGPEKRYPLERIAKPEEIAGAVTWLCSDEASYITGSAMAIDGGLTIR